MEVRMHPKTASLQRSVTIVHSDVARAFTPLHWSSGSVREQGPCIRRTPERHETRTLFGIPGDALQRGSGLDDAGRRASPAAGLTLAVGLACMSFSCFRVHVTVPSTWMRYE